jgi:Domain of unknown function (DUF4116)
MSDLRARLNKILELHGEALSEAVNLREPNSQEAQLPAKDLVLRFAGSDPTDGKSRTQWLVKTYIRDEQFKLEDLGRVDAALAAFERFKRKLPVEKRELSRFKSLRALEELVDPFVKAEAKARLERDLSSATGREKRRLEEWKARDESIILQEGEGLPTIAVPMTEFASCWWGRGTKWCTAAEKDNIFARYHKDAPLLIIVCPDGAKFQMHIKKDDFQFMDNMDTTVDKKIIMERWNEFQSLFYWAIEQNGMTLQHVPEITLDLCRLAVEQNGLALEYVYINNKTPELCRLAVEQNGRALHHVPENYWTPKLCRIAVEQDGRALGYVPVNKRTPELYSIAVQQNGLVLYDVLKEHRTPELCYMAVQQKGNVLCFVPEDYRTPELCRIAIAQHGMALEYVPKDKMTPELCRLAVEQNGEALKHVPKDEITLELCRLAIEQNGMALCHVPTKLKTPELFQLAIQQNGEALRHVPNEYKTPELCLMAIQQNGRALGHVPNDYKNPDLCRLAIQQHGIALSFVPGEQRDFEICRIAVAQDRNALYAVPKELKTPEFMALIPPTQPKWNVDILQGLGQHSKISNESITNHNNGNTSLNPV